MRQPATETKRSPLSTENLWENRSSVNFDHVVASPFTSCRGRVVGRAADDVPEVSSGVTRAVLSERGFSTPSAATSKTSSRVALVVVVLSNTRDYHTHRRVAMDTSSLDGAGGSYLDNSIDRRCLEWEASEYYNNAESCPCLDDPDAEGQVRRTEPSTRRAFS
jgi:hypothetical protein